MLSHKVIAGTLAVEDKTLILLLITGKLEFTNFAALAGAPLKRFGLCVDLEFLMRQPSTLTFIRKL